MNSAWFRARLRRHADKNGAHPAIESPRGSIRYDQLAALIDGHARWLASQGAARVALLVHNCVDAVLLDLASHDLPITLIPLPPFFSDAQIRHALAAAEATLLITDDVDRAHALCSTQAASRLGSLHALCIDRAPSAMLDPGKLTFTSGTTGTPKGVSIPTDTQLRVAASLADATRASPADRHLCLLPLAILLETIGGVYQTLIGGGTLVLPSQAATGIDGASTVDPERLLETLDRTRATIAIFMPQYLADVVAVMRSPQVVAPAALRFIGVGGARVPPALLEEAAQHRLPAYQGYGLTEAASVVALNLPHADRIGSVGRVLPHAEVRFAADGEILVRGATFARYVGHDAHPDGQGWWPTGDLGRRDDEGYLYLEGRKHDVICTSHGRNISRRWLIESLLEDHRILAARIEGDGEPGPTAELVCPGGAEVARAALERLNETLPPYARILRHTLIEPTRDGRDAGTQATAAEGSARDSRASRPAPAGYDTANPHLHAVRPPHAGDVPSAWTRGDIA